MRRRATNIFKSSAIVLAALVGLLALLAQLFVAPQIRSQLVAAVADHLHASLTIGKIRYQIPFTVHLYDVRLIAHPEQPGGGDELFSAKKINLTLASIPIGRGPVVIERLAVIDPVARITRQADGSIVGLDLLRPTTEPVHPRAPMKLSDLLRLQRLMLRGGVIAYQDRATTSPPSEWRQIDSDVTLTRHSPSLYGFRFTATDGSIAHSSVVGTFDVDSLQLNLTRLAASITSSDPRTIPNPDPLPPQVRDLVHRFGVAGGIILEGSADVPFQTPEKSKFSGDLTINGTKAELPDANIRLDGLTIRLHGDNESKNATTRPITVALHQFDAAAGGAKLHIAPTTARFDPKSNHWSINGITGSLDSPTGGTSPAPWNFTGHADFHADLVPKSGGGLAAALGSLTISNLYFKPPDVSEAVSKFSGHAELAASNEAGAPLGAIVLRNVSMYYGKDLWTLKRAELPLTAVSGRFQIDHIDAAMTFAKPPMHYPGDFGDVLDQLQPAGPYVMNGVAAMQWVDYPTPHYSPLWDMHIRPDLQPPDNQSTSSLTLLDGRLPVTQIVGELQLTKHAFDLQHLTGTAFGGDLTLSVVARVADPLTYQGKLDLNHASIEQAAVLANDGKSTPDLPKGSAHLTLDFFSRPAPRGNARAAATTNVDDDNATMQQLVDILGGNGRVHIVNGDLWSGPVLQRLTSHIQLTRDAFTAGEGGGIFSIENRAIHIRHGALNTPAIGLDGSGTVTFTRQLDLSVVAAPLGNWKSNLEKTNIPIVSGAMAVVAGALQKAVNGAQELLYQFRVTGSADNPKVVAVPTPFLTDSAAKLFAGMIHPNGENQLMEQIDSAATTAPATTPVLSPTTTPLEHAH